MLYYCSCLCVVGLWHNGIYTDRLHLNKYVIIVVYFTITQYLIEFIFHSSVKTKCNKIMKTLRTDWCYFIKVCLHEIMFAPLRGNIIHINHVKLKLANLFALRTT